MTLLVVATIMADNLNGELMYLVCNRSLATYTPVPLNLFETNHERYRRSCSGRSDHDPAQCYVVGYWRRTSPCA